ncbi:hypothetical protein SLEP1_g10075 [Rubroshorea leprosula]|uniref:(+)-neomenthol dehydrogenase-like n=1 Tax=Rubroshorea leprosula TaxID=152421 RepID=A0AAV5IIA5_9ROSI|nr:hypothetical protein SLEP1_g10075 [Rubroshorea leprosula]
MEDISTFLAKNRDAVVTGANKGIGLGICKQLASKGVTVVSTARDEKRGIVAVEKLIESGHSDFILFHQLDVADPASIASPVEFIKSQFGKLDILGLISGNHQNSAWCTSQLDSDAYSNTELAEEGLKTNYHGAKRIIRHITAEFGAAVLRAAVGEELAEGHGDVGPKELMHMSKLKESGLSEYIVFHQLDVADPATIASLADFVKRQFGKLDILVNNAGIGGAATDRDAVVSKIQAGEQINWSALTTETYELAEEGLRTNYFGAKMMCETFIPLLQLSDSPRIVNVSSSMGRLKNLSNEWAKSILSDAENLTEERVDDVLNKYLKDFKGGSLEAQGWPAFMSAYTLSKAAMNAYTRILAKKHPSFCINCVCPGYLKTDMSFNTGVLTVEEGAQGPVRLALLPNGAPSGLFFYRLEESEF